ncbi:unnamed protein product [Durusdinium trenchii]|uniref:Uncharacterized protein n=2 Tax=Durusdinium trenchii TaxID=1381693 RepID=A0ABP0PAF4_9DINO
MAYEPTYQSPQFHGGDGMVTPSGSIESQQGRCTLDEPVTETIMRDLRSIGMKLKYVMLPRAREDKGQGLREWDLWGPLVLCLALGIMLSMHAEQASLAFGLVFIIVWVGSGIVTINALLLKGKISFFQERIPGELGHLLPVGVHLPPRGYCIFPLVIAAFCSLMLNVIWLKVIFVTIGFTWATGASVNFMSELLPEDRKALGVYPVWLFYVAIAWLILIS